MSCAKGALIPWVFQFSICIARVMLVVIALIHSFTDQGHQNIVGRKEACRALWRLCWRVHELSHGHQLPALWLASACWTPDTRTNSIKPVEGVTATVPGFATYSPQKVLIRRALPHTG